MSGPTGEQVEVRRSRRRRRTVSARRDGERILVLIPASMSEADERVWVPKMVQRVLRAEQRRRTPPGEEDLLAWSQRLSDRYLGGLAQPDSVRWVDNQGSRWGSCTPGEKTIRLSTRLQQMPRWVVEYVIVHELAHLLEPGHDARFWAWVRHYPLTAKAQGYLLGWSAAHEIEPPPGETEPEPE
ncbi:M48 family metallopeptidase [Nocardioides sp. CFH 31398]|uniref:M48 metallopeptidase family protein n=1 Tax=Nocardioides sp. CFH 31398 TaxID=2919579 RepID=UPI001F0651C5|nr:M48 family metallopeptidase [Nocardioides sp. CFH 31398]MCH1866512.1 M48 family metallopeptidase [Nocardioides sp. CFH 31398]